MFLEDLFVKEEGRGSGAGGRLFEHVRQLGAHRGCGRMTWNVLVWNSLAREFYHRRGAEWAEDWLVYRSHRTDHVDRTEALTVTLTVGTRLGPYEVTGRLGAGGMGEVWRATDSRLDREVAIKVLPAGFIQDSERLSRFEREAKLLAQLHHPNIASIFGFEEGDGIRALVMELVEGPTLAERLAAGPLSVDDSLSIARQIAEGLEEAHAKGIIHRDLKPQNVKAPIEGTVKVLDFGLAKAMDPAGVASTLDLALSPAHDELADDDGDAAARSSA